MDVKLPVFLTLIATFFIPSFSFNPFSSLRGVVRNGQLQSKPSRSDLVNNLGRLYRKNALSSILLRGQPVINMGIGDDRLNDQFNWTSCGAANQIMEIKKLMLKPSPLSLPGTFTFGFDIAFHDDIGESDVVSATLDIEYNARGTWIKIPCLGGIGSCTYKDLCAELSGLSCPPEITSKGIPCNCPFKKGEYKLPEYSVTVLAEVFIAGNYRLTADITSSTKGAVGCYKLNFSVET